MGQGSERSHVPVMVAEVIGLLITRRDGAYLDLTAGAGGHLGALAAELDPSARLYGLDRDPEAVAVATRHLDGSRQKTKVVQSSYADAVAARAAFDDTTYDGMLLDLGLSSLQLDDPGRGFSFRHEGRLDMRFDPEAGGPTAAELVNSLSEERLTDIISRYGEEKRARRLAGAIVRERRKKMILTTAELAGVVQSQVSPNHLNKTLARVFQALRIAVNRELEILEAALPDLLTLLNAGGRLAVIAYHSLEDRIVKQFFQREAKGCICPPEIPVCVCGRTPTVKIITRRPVTPSDAEIAQNTRARSAKLRVAERLDA